MLLEKGDILIAKSGNSKCCIFEGDENKYVACNFIFVLRVNQKIALPKIIFYQLKNMFDREKFNNCYSRVTIQNLNLPLFLKSKLFVNDIKIQEKYISKLNDINESIEIARQVLQLSNELIDTLFAEMFGNPIDNEFGFEKVNLLDVGELKNGMNFHFDDKGVELNCLGVGDFKNNDVIYDTSSLPLISLNEKPSEEYLLKNNDIVFVRSNGNKELVGRSVLVTPNMIETTFSGFCIRFRRFNNLFNDYYLLYYFKNPYVRKKMRGRGANIQNLNQQILASLEIPQPSLKSQQLFESKVISIYEVINESNKTIEYFHNYQNKIIDSYCGGEEDA